MLALLVPLTVFLAQQESKIHSRASTNFTSTSGRPFADSSPWNQPIGSNVEVDPNSAAMVAKLATGSQGAGLYEFGTPVYFADSRTPKYQINCTENWGNCGLESESVPIPDNAQPAPGSDGQMVVIDLAANKSYEFWVYNKDKATTSWGGILPIDGDGRGTGENSAVGAGVSRLAGVVRTYEIEQGVIDHALVFSTEYCLGPDGGTNFRFPATKTDGKYIGSDGIPEGARVQLDPAINVDAIAGISKGEKAVAKALQKYGAYAIDCGGAAMAFSFENPIGKNDPYPAAGLVNDYFEMDKIPWDKLRVLKAWNSYTGGSTNPSPTGTTDPTFGVIAPCPSCGSPTSTLVPSGVSIIPSTITNPAPSEAPCDSSSASLAHDKKKSKHKEHNGGVSGLMEMLLRFLIELLNMILKLFGGAPLQIPDEGSPLPQQPVTPTNPTSNPTSNPSPSPCIPEETPTIPVIPSVSQAPSLNPTAPLPTAQATGSWWKPTADKPLQMHWQLSTEFNPATDFVPGATVYDIDGEYSTKEDVDAIHAKGFIAICYIDAGVFEDYRSDASKFPQSVIGKKDVGWDGSFWLDIRQTDVLLPIMEARIRDWCKAKGFDAVEPDEITNYSNDSGFPLTYQDQINYNKAIAALAHKYNLSVGLKGDQEQAKDLEPFFDWNLTEECYQYNECDLITAFPQNNKATWVVEYAANPNCTDAKSKKLNAMKRDLNLVGPKASGYLYQPCIPSGATSW